MFEILERIRSVSPLNVRVLLSPGLVSVSLSVTAKRSDWSARPLGASEENKHVKHLCSSRSDRTRDDVRPD